MEPRQLLGQFLNQLNPLPDDVLEKYLAAWEVKTYSRREIMTTAGDVQKHILFVYEGLQKSYYLHEGKQHVIAFTYPPSFSGIPESFITQTPSKYFLEALTETKVLQLSFDQQKELMEEFRPIETLLRKSTEFILIGMIERHYELMAYDIETRFKTFVNRSPHLLNQVPHKDLASYLRIDPTNFSKLLSSVKV